MTELSREAILAMEPGGELDALVAEKVMGRLLTWNMQFQYLTDEERKMDRRAFDNIPEYSTNIAAAWEVVEKLGPFVQLTAESYHGKVVWHATFSVVDDVEADTAPLAICQAALLTTLEESK